MIRKTINIYTRNKDPRGRLISNLAHSPFVLDGVKLASIEGFHQGIKFRDQAKQKAVFKLVGNEARQARIEANKKADGFVYWKGRAIVNQSEGYHRLYRRALLAKFTQHQPSREALVSTGDALLEHRLPRQGKRAVGAAPSRSIQMLYEIRQKLLKREDHDVSKHSTSRRTMSTLNQVVQQLQARRRQTEQELEKLTQAIKALTSLGGTSEPGGRGGKRQMSRKGRLAISRAKKAWWAKKKAGK
jgi:predicted NAD-dependent protein-ADP-ribosyltransferase YbiA (DUF1768 family)